MKPLLSEYVDLLAKNSVSRVSDALHRVTKGSWFESGAERARPSDWQNLLDKCYQTIAELDFDQLKCVHIQNDHTTTKRTFSKDDVDELHAARVHFWSLAMAVRTQHGIDDLIYPSQYLTMKRPPPGWTRDPPNNQASNICYHVDERGTVVRGRYKEPFVPVRTRVEPMWDAAHFARYYGQGVFYQGRP